VNVHPGRALWLLAAALAAGCASPQPVELGAGAQIRAEDNCPAGDVAALARALADGGTGGAGGVSLPEGPVKPSFERSVLTPPAKAGESAFELSGCLAAPATEEAGARHPPPGGRAPGAGAVRVSSLHGGALVVHELPHACCLRAAVRSSLDGAALVVTEELRGTPCRCTCRSEIRTAVAAPPGRYSLQVRVVSEGKAETAYSGPAAVR